MRNSRNILEVLMKITEISTWNDLY